MLNVIGNRKYFVGLSAVLVIASVIALFYPGLRIGVDFKSGSSLTIAFEGADPGSAAVREAFSDSGHDEAVVQSAGGGQYFVRTADLGATGREPVEAALKAKFGANYEIIEVNSVGAAVARETVRTAIFATFVGTAFVMLYIMYSFRSVPASYRYAIAAIVPLGHDVLITMGVFAVLGALIGTEVNAIFVVGVLTLIGYTVNNTIVVFDRIRENVRLAPSRPFGQTVNLAINETLTRNLNVSVTTLVAILAMLLLGGATLRDFLIILFVGLFVGTYSSTFIAAQLVVAWESGELGRWLRFWRRRDSTRSGQH
jgi:preprotein translocase subunit SecF